MMSTRYNDPLSFHTSKNDDYVTFDGSVEWMTYDSNDEEVTFKVDFKYTNLYKQIVIKEVYYDAPFDLTDEELEEAISNEMGQVEFDNPLIVRQ